MKKITILLAILIIVGGSIFYFWEDFLDFYLKSYQRSPLIEKKITNFLIKEAEKQILTPPPLRAEKEDPQSFLTQAGVIHWTNIQREKYGLPPLKENATLNLMAEEKVGLKMNVAKTDLKKVIDILPALQTPTISELSDKRFVDVDTIIDEKIVRDLIPKLKKAGAEGIVEYPLNKIIL